MRLSKGEVRTRFAFAALMIAVGLTPLIFLALQATRFQNHALAGRRVSLTVHPSAMIETTLLLALGIALAVATYIETRRGAVP
jgi:hypothetical protein